MTSSWCNPNRSYLGSIKQVYIKLYHGVPLELGIFEGCLPGLFADNYYESDALDESVILPKSTKNPKE
jgi:hypothetical protein